MAQNPSQRHEGSEFEDPLSNYEPEKFVDPVDQALAERAVSEMPMHPYAHVSSEITVQRAMQALSGLQVSSLLVIDQGELRGVFTERDVLERVADRYAELRDQPLATVMTSAPVVVHESDPWGAALAAIVAGGYRHVPVVGHHEEVLGVVSPRRLALGLKPLVVEV